MKLPSSLLLHPANTDRPVDARWQRITDLANCRKHAWHANDDEWVRRGLLYLNQLRACRNDADRQRLTAEMPAYDAAYRLHATPDKLSRGILEARLLAGQSLDETAAACGLSRDAVEAYHQLHFDVTSKLKAKNYILCNAIGNKIWQGLTEDDVDVILKHYAFLKGPVFLEWMLPYFMGGWTVPQRLEDASPHELESLVAVLQTKALVQVRVLPFPKCLRALRLSNLVKELEDYTRAVSAPRAKSRVHKVFGELLPLRIAIPTIHEERAEEVPDAFGLETPVPTLPATEPAANGCIPSPASPAPALVPLRCLNGSVEPWPGCAEATKTTTTVGGDEGDASNASISETVRRPVSPPPLTPSVVTSDRPDAKPSRPRQIAGTAARQPCKN